MKTKILLVVVIALFLLGTAFTFVGDVRATESRLGFSLPRSVIGSGGFGGGVGSYTLTSTLGQPVASSVSGGEYTLNAGFWGQALMEWFENFLPLILR